MQSVAFRCNQSNFDAISQTSTHTDAHAGLASHFPALHRNSVVTPRGLSPLSSCPPPLPVL
eukprot:3546620-Pyramimonas_sp.AAC.1